MTYPVEGGSDETDLKQQNDSGDTIQPNDIPLVSAILSYIVLLFVGDWSLQL
jgi:hypothetical protein